MARKRPSDVPEETARILYLTYGHVPVMSKAWQPGSRYWSMCERSPLGVRNSGPAAISAGGFVSYGCPLHCKRF